jgi:hypothetical protein
MGYKLKIYRHHISWPISFFNVRDLRPWHFEPIHAEMEHEKEGKITIKMILDLVDILEWKD